MTITGNHMRAAEGKVFRRVGTDEVMGEEIFLGLSYYIGGVPQSPPHRDEPGDFEEIDPPGDMAEVADMADADVAGEGGGDA